jgi:hypothetical protein
MMYFHVLESLNARLDALCFIQTFVLVHHIMTSMCSHLILHSIIGELISFSGDQLALQTADSCLPSA